MNRLNSILFFTCQLLSYFNLPGQVTINSLPYSYSQNFNTLSASGSSNAWSNNVTLLGWYAMNEVSGDYTSYKAGSGSSVKTALYSFGDGPERALGSFNQNASGDIAFGVLFQNNSGSTINSVTLTFSAEQWNRTRTSSKGYHRTKLSYQVANDIDVTSNGILTGNFIELPEGYLITKDTTTGANHSALDGNDAVNSATISIQMPLLINGGQKLFIRFYDENVGSLDRAMAVDNLSVDFSTAIVSSISVTSGYSIYPYLETGIISEIPKAGDGIAYTKVTASAYVDLENIFSDFYRGNYGSAGTTAALYGYVISRFIHNGTTYHVLRKQNNSAYYWGTYVINASPAKTCVTIEAPHPVKDAHTGTQAAAVFEFLGASNFLISGISRCASGINTSCTGSTSVCGAPGPFKISDTAHNDSTAFHIASKTLSGANTHMSFVQLHGFKQRTGDPEFVFSNGTNSTPTVDHLANLKSEFQTSFPSLDVEVVHLDGATKLRAFTNVFGRLLNNYLSNICTSSAKPATPSGRFLHLEQFFGFRNNASFYDSLATMLDASIDCGISLPIELLSFDVTVGEDGNAILQWNVAWEKEVNRYEILKSPDGSNFYTVGYLTARNSVDGHTYQYIDHHIEDGINYYQIKQIDFDGIFTFSPIRFVKGSSLVSVYPNPVSDLLFVRGVHQNQNVEIISCEGVSMKKEIQTIDDHYAIDLSGLYNGIYILEINGKRFKIVKK